MLTATFHDFSGKPPCQKRKSCQYLHCTCTRLQGYRDRPRLTGFAKPRKNRFLSSYSREKKTTRKNTQSTLVEIQQNGSFASVSQNSNSAWEGARQEFCNLVMSSTFTSAVKYNGIIMQAWCHYVISQLTWMGWSLTFIRGSFLVPAGHALPCLWGTAWFWKLS